MVDYRVTFKGDLGNLAQFDAAIKNSVQQSARAIEQANKALLSQVGAFNGVFNPSSSGAGLFASGLKTQVDGINRTFIQSGQVVRRVVADYELAFDKAKKTFSLSPIHTDLYQSPYKQIIGDLDAYERALTKMAPTEQKILADRENSLKRTIPLRERLVALDDIQAAKSAQIDREKDLSRSYLDPAARKLAEAQALQQTIDPTNTKAVNRQQREVDKLQKQFDALQASANKVIDPINQDLQQAQVEAAKLRSQVALIEGAQQYRAGQLRNKNSAYTQTLGKGVYGPAVPGDLDLATTATPPIQRDLATVLARSEDLRKNLLKAGLGKGASYNTPEFQKALAEQEASITSYTKNLRTNVSTIQGVFHDADGLANKFAVDLDSQGKVIGRWGGQLAGAGQFLRQTVRDFQKVIEWTVATTLVFGTLATVVGQLKSINELNASLAHLSITAQTSVSDTSKLFSSLGQVAIETATPLNELVKVADDIALATKEAGDSTEQWQGKIVDLTRAVGIFTNLAGVDTVQAADQLSAAFKQLGIAPSELVGVLSKVTAVAGGQSTAIADIVKGLSSVSEAAKAAGLSLDEQITSIQVLSQVTNKSSDEIATSFKNLFGSISSVGSEKILAKFGIAIRDSEGGMRDFLDIYRDIRKAVDTGVIPENRLSDVLRGISGGPRRAPDAAALLANIGRIDATVGTSINATNEALVANAKILDTNAAKIQQFQNAVDIVLFEKFGRVVQDLITGLTEFGTVVLGILNLLPTGFISLGVQIGTVLLVTKGLTAAFRQIGIGGLIAEVTGLSGAFTRLAATEAAAAAAASGVKTGPGTVIPLGAGGAGGKGGIADALARFSKNKLAVGAALLGGTAAVAGGASILEGGVNPGTVGSIAQVAGSLALMAGVSAPLGIGLLAVGTALQFVSSSSKETALSQKDLQSQLLTNIDALKSAQAEVEGFAKAQSDAQSKIIGLKAGGVTPDEQKLLTAATNDYVEATLSLVDANAKAADSFKDVQGTLAALHTDYKAFIKIADLVDPNSPQIKELRQQLVGDLLQSTGQSVYAGTPQDASRTFTAAAGTSTIATVNPQNYSLAQAPIDLADLIKNPDLLKQLFDVGNGGGSSFGIPKNDLSLGYLQTALTTVGANLEKYGVSEEQFANLSQAIGELSSSTSTLAQNAGIVAQTNAATQANSILGIFNADQTSNANLAASFLAEIQKTQRESPGETVYTPGGAQVIPSKPVQDLQQNFADLQDAAKVGLELPNKLLLDIAENTLKAGKATIGLGSLYDQLKGMGDEALNKGIYEWLKKSGVGEEQLIQLAKELNIELDKTADKAPEIGKAFEDARRSATETFAKRQFDLLVQENSGAFDKNAKGLKILRDQNKQAYNSTLQLQEAMKGLSESSLQDLNNQLANTIGLQGDYINDTDLAGLEAGQLQEKVLALSGKFYDNAVAAGVNADGLKLLQTDIAKVIGLIVAIPPYKKVLIDIQTTYTNLENAGSRGYLSAAAAQALATSQKNAKDAEAKDKKAGTDPQSQIDKILRDINKIIAGGSGNNLGKAASAAAKKAGAGLDVSEIDLPDEVADATNRSALIQEAIKRARALQHLIPGEDKAAKNDVVELLKGTQRILEVRGVKDDYLRKALEELADVEKKRLDFETKADTIRRIRIQSGDFSGIANVPLNSRTGISLGGANGPVNITLNVNGTVLTPAQLAQFADLLASSLKRQIANG